MFSFAVKIPTCGTAELNVLLLYSFGFFHLIPFMTFNITRVLFPCWTFLSSGYLKKAQFLFQSFSHLTGEGNIQLSCLTCSILFWNFKIIFTLLDTVWLSVLTLYLWLTTTPEIISHDIKFWDSYSALWFFPTIFSLYTISPCWTIYLADHFEPWTLFVPLIPWPGSLTQCLSLCCHANSLDTCSYF